MGCTCSTQTQDSLGIRVNQSTRSSSHHVLVAAGHISEAKGNDRNPDHKYRALVLVCRPVRSLANSTSGNFVLRQQWNMHWGLQVANSYPQDGYIWDLTVENGQILTCGRVWPEHREGIKDDRIIKENVEVASNLSDVEIQTIASNILMDLKVPHFTHIDQEYSQWSRNCQHFAGSLILQLSTQSDRDAAQARLFLANQSKLPGWGVLVQGRTNVTEIHAGH